MTERLVRTPTETLMAALAECEDADEVLIVIRHKDAISWHETIDSRAGVLGLLDFVQCCIRGRIMNELRSEE